MSGLVGATTFQVTFDPGTVGLRTATLTIENDDEDVRGGKEDDDDKLRAEHIGARFAVSS